jgi:hypothetical protein
MKFPEIGYKSVAVIHGIGALPERNGLFRQLTIKYSNYIGEKTGTQVNFGFLGFPAGCGLPGGEISSSHIETYEKGRPPFGRASLIVQLL